MKTLRFSGLMYVALAMCVLPAAAQTPDGITPANEGICDPLTDATPGLYGLCVAMCEAQDCEAELDPNTGEVVYDASCKPSSRQLLGNYNKIAGPSDPRMPCVTVACPCWTEAQLDDVGGRRIGDFSFDRCLLGDTYAGLWGSAVDGSGGEVAYVLYDTKQGLMCLRRETTPPTYLERSIGADAFEVCQQAVIDECTSRGITP